MCDLLIDGLCDDEGGSGAGLGNITGFFSGSQTISGGNILLEDGTGLLSEDGGKIQQESAGNEIDILNEDGSKILNEDGSKLLNEQISSGATPLMFVSKPCQYVIIAPKSTNTGTVWVGGSDVEVGVGIPLKVGDDDLSFLINNLNKVFITGNNGDGVTFVYGTAAL